MSDSNYDIEPTKQMLDTVLVQSCEGKWYRFSLWEDRVFIMHRRQEWKNWEQYDSQWFDEPGDRFELAEIYSRYYKREPARNAHKKTLTKAIWVKMWLNAEDRTGTYQRTPTNPVTGERERKRILDRRGYRALDGPSSEHLPNQALIVHRELLRLHKQLNLEIISEAQVIDMMKRLRDSGVLKTKQDPFRIFQYYRPALIKANKLEFVE